MRDTVLDARLMSAASFVRQDAIFADIGTDHAFLPVFLLECGRITHAIAADINEGPLESAKKTVEAAGVADRVELIRTNGAIGLDGRGITDYAICGMGGELIADIIASSEHLMSDMVNLILIPMSRQGHLRAELLGRGFKILEERYSFADGKYYVCILASFRGEPERIDPISAELGMIPNENGGRVEYIGYLESKLSAFKKRHDGLLMGGVDPKCERELIIAINDRIKAVKELLL